MFIILTVLLIIANFVLIKVLNAQNLAKKDPKSKKLVLLTVVFSVTYIIRASIATFDAVEYEYWTISSPFYRYLFWYLGKTGVKKSVIFY